MDDTSTAMRAGRPTGFHREAVAEQVASLRRIAEHVVPGAEVGVAARALEARPSARGAQLEIVHLRALRGPNHWSLDPVIACELSFGELSGWSTRDDPTFRRLLIDHLPNLADHTCSKDEAGGFGGSMQAGTDLAHALEHVALELQSLAGPPVGFGRVSRGDHDRCWTIVGYEEEAVGLEAMQIGVRLLRACLDGVRFPIGEEIGRLHRLYEDVRLGPSTAAIVEEARRRGIPVRRLNSRSLVQLGLGSNLRRIQAVMSDATSAIALDIAQDKDDTRNLLANVGLPVARGEVVEDVEEAVELAGELGFPVIIKPVSANHGRGVSPPLQDEDALRRAWAPTVHHGREVIVEQFAEGNDHRILVVGGKVVAVAERLPAHVVGDGEGTIRELVEAVNRDERRGRGHSRALSFLEIDEDMEAYLAGAGLTLESVPAAGERIRLRSAANLSTGGTAIDRTEEMHPDNVTACEMAAHIVGLDLAGIDVVTSDIAKPFRETGAVILEVNAGPGIRMHLHPTEGRARNVAAPIIEMLFPPGTESTIPVIAVTGTNGKTTTVRLIAHIFRNTGKRVGFTTTDGVYLGNRLVMEGDMTGPRSANAILSNPTVDVAVLETARGGILRAGLGFEEADVGVVLNVSEDHLGLGGIDTLEDLAELKGIVAAVVKRDGHAVLSADDPHVFRMRERTSGDVVLFSSGTREGMERVDEHLAAGGIAVLVEDGAFLVRRGRLRIPIAEIAEVPLMMGGAAEFQTENVLAAIAAAYAQGVRYDDIRSGLLSFFPSRSMTPGRLNLVPIGNAKVIVDYAHNPAAIRAIVDLARRVQADHRVGLIAVPGDRRDEDLRAAGRIAAELDAVVIKEDADLRGRQPGEIAGLIREGLLDGGMAEDRIREIRSEMDALRVALDELRDGHLLVVLVEDVDEVLDLVRVREQAAGQ